MTNKEAAQAVEVLAAVTEWGYPLDFQEALDMACAALNKQVPKKPKADGWLYCGCCGISVLMETDSEGKRIEWCPACGQRIDWSEYDE